MEAGGHEKGVVGAFLETDQDLTFGDGDVSRAVDEVPKQVGGFGGGVTVADAGRQQVVKGARHESELEVTVDLERDRRGERVDVEEFDAVGDVAETGVRASIFSFRTRLPEERKLKIEALTPFSFNSFLGGDLLS